MNKESTRGHTGWKLKGGVHFQRHQFISVPPSPTTEISPPSHCSLLEGPGLPTARENRRFTHRLSVQLPGRPCTGVRCVDCTQILTEGVSEHWNLAQALLANCVSWRGLHLQDGEKSVFLRRCHLRASGASSQLGCQRGAIFNSHEGPRGLVGDLVVYPKEADDRFRFCPGNQPPALNFSQSDPWIPSLVR